MVPSIKAKIHLGSQNVLTLGLVGNGEWQPMLLRSTILFRATTSLVYVLI